MEAVCDLHVCMGPLLAVLDPYGTPLTVIDWCCAAPGGKCEELERCTEAGDLNCLQTSAIPLCNLEVQETRIEKPWQKVLGLAAAHGQLEVVQLFVNSPLRWWDMEAPINDSGENVLMHAAAHGEYEIVTWLLKQGADVRKQSDAGETARDLAAASENPARTLGALDKFAAENTEALVKSLRTNSGLREAQMDGFLKGGADLSHVDEETQLTPLGLAVKNGIVEATAKLLENNAPTHHQQKTAYRSQQAVTDASNPEIKVLRLYAATGEPQS